MRWVFHTRRALHEWRAALPYLALSVAEKTAAGRQFVRKMLRRWRRAAQDSNGICRRMRSALGRLAYIGLHCA